MSPLLRLRNHAGRIATLFRERFRPRPLPAPRNPEQSRYYVPPERGDRMPRPEEVGTRDDRSTPQPETEARQDDLDRGDVHVIDQRSTDYIRLPDHLQNDPVRPLRFSSSSPATMPWLLPSTPSALAGLTADQATLGDLQVRAASIVGVGHRCAQPVGLRQDAYRLARDHTGRHLIVAVADGMSDSGRSELGAQFATANAVALLRLELDGGRPVDELSGRELFTEVAGIILNEGRTRNLDADQLRTTLAVLVVPVGNGNGPRRAWAASIGDTCVWKRLPDGWELVVGLSKPEVGDNTLAEYLPHTATTVKARSFWLSDEDTVAIFSDGVSDAFTQVEHAGLTLTERWSTPPSLLSFVRDVDFEARQQQDDRTAVVVWCRPRAER